MSIWGKLALVPPLLVGLFMTVRAVFMPDALREQLGGLAATALPSDGSCGAGSTFTGTSTLTVSGASLGQAGGAGSDSCTFDVSLAVPGGAAAGAYTLTSSGVAVTQGGSSWTSEKLNAGGREAQLQLILGANYPSWSVSVLCDDGVIDAEIFENRVLARGANSTIAPLDHAKRSFTVATGAACQTSWTSVMRGRPISFFTLARTARPSSMPGPRKASTRERFALSKLALKIRG